MNLQELFSLVHGPRVQTENKASKGQPPVNYQVYEDQLCDITKRSDELADLYAPTMLLWRDVMALRNKAIEVKLEERCRSKRLATLNAIWIKDINWLQSYKQ